jgi:hypothetical protein
MSRALPLVRACPLKTGTDLGRARISGAAQYLVADLTGEAKPRLSADSRAARVSRITLEAKPRGCKTLEVGLRNDRRGSLTEQSPDTNKQ